VQGKCGARDGLLRAGGSLLMRHRNRLTQSFSSCYLCFDGSLTFAKRQQKLKVSLAATAALLRL